MIVYRARCSKPPSAGALGLRPHYSALADEG